MATMKSSGFNPQGLQDERLILTSYPALSYVSNLCPVTRASPSIFVSAIRRHFHESPASLAVLDCRPREHVATRVAADVCSLLKSVCVADVLPPHQKCDHQIREHTRNWLKQITHLKYVFIGDNSPIKQSLALTGNMMGRTLRYIAQSGSKPKKIVLLDCGFITLARLPMPSILLTNPFPLWVITPAKPNISPGIYSSSRIPSPSDASDFTTSISKLGVSVLINLTPIQLTLPSSTNVQVLAAGPAFLPLRDEDQAAKFFRSALTQLCQALERWSAVCFIDQPSKLFTAEFCVMALVLLGRHSAQGAIDLVRSRISPPEFDSYCLAALSHLENTDNAVDKAIQCIAMRYRTPTSDDQDKNDPMPLLREARPESLREKLDRIRSLADKQTFSQYEPSVKLVTKLLNNVLLEPENPKFRIINGNNVVVSRVFHDNQLAIELVEAAGFTRATQSEKWTLSTTANLQLVRDVVAFAASL